MGFHVCEYCLNQENQPVYPNTSSGDVTLEFSSGWTWVMPDMILHYVADHKWQPPYLFVQDVMNSQLVGGQRVQTKSMPSEVGYLSGPFQTGDVPQGFVERLEALMHQAAEVGSRGQKRGGVPMGE